MVTTSDSDYCGTNQMSKKPWQRFLIPLNAHNSNLQYFNSLVEGLYKSGRVSVQRLLDNTEEVTI